MASNFTQLELTHHEAKELAKTLYTEMQELLQQYTGLKINEVGSSAQLKLSNNVIGQHPSHIYITLTDTNDKWSSDVSIDATVNVNFLLKE